MAPLRPQSYGKHHNVEHAGQCKRGFALSYPLELSYFEKNKGNSFRSYFGAEDGQGLVIRISAEKAHAPFVENVIGCIFFRIGCDDNEN